MSVYILVPGHTETKVQPFRCCETVWKAPVHTPVMASLLALSSKQDIGPCPFSLSLASAMHSVLKSLSSGCLGIFSSLHPDREHKGMKQLMDPGKLTYLQEAILNHILNQCQLTSLGTLFPQYPSTRKFPLLGSSQNYVRHSTLCTRLLISPKTRVSFMVDLQCFPFEQTDSMVASNSS